MKSWLIKKEDGERFWSLYGWGSQMQAMRFTSESDAKAYEGKYGIKGQVTSAVIDDNRRPDSQQDYNPFST